MIHPAEVLLAAQPVEQLAVELCSFGSVITSPAGSIRPTASGFDLERQDRKPWRFAKAVPAIKALRGLNKPSRSAQTSANLVSALS